MWEGVRYQMYESSDGHVLFMASEQAFWRNFCEALDRMDLFDRWPGSKYADHARGNLELQRELRDIFRTKSSAEWLEFGDRVNTPIAPVNNAKNVVDDPQFQDRLPLFTTEQVGCEQLPLPVKFFNEELPVPTHAPTVGQHTEEVLGEVLGLDDDRLSALRKQGIFG